MLSLLQLLESFSEVECNYLLGSVALGLCGWASSPPLTGQAFRYEDSMAALPREPQEAQGKGEKLHLKCQSALMDLHSPWAERDFWGLMIHPTPIFYSKETKTQKGDMK